MTEVFIRTPTGWAPLGDGGNGDGPPTASETWDLHWKGAWRNNVTYIEDDVVSHAGEYWITPEDLDAGELAPGTPSMPLEITHNPGSVQWTTPQVCKPLTTDPQPWSALNFQSGNQAGWAYFYFNVQTGGTLTVDFVTGQNGEWHHYPASGTALGSHTGDDTLTVTAQRYYIRVWGNYSDMSGTIKLTPGTAVLAPPAMSPAAVWNQTWLPPGPEGEWGTHWKGEWEAEGTYVEGDVVYYDGDFWIVTGDDMNVPNVPGQVPFEAGFVAEATTIGTGNVSVSVPSGSQVGDQMLIITSRFDGQPGPLTIPTIPSGFTRVTSSLGSGGAAYTSRGDVFSKILTAGDISAGTVVVNISSQQAVVHARTYRQCGAPSKIGTSDLGSGFAAKNVMSLSQAIGDIVVASNGAYGNGVATIGTPLTGVARSYTSNSGQGALGVIEFVKATSAGASPTTPTINANPSGSGTGTFGIVFALVPSSTGVWQETELSLPTSGTEGGEYYEQAEEPETTTLGAMWLDTDAVPEVVPSGGGGRYSKLYATASLASNANEESALVFHPSFRMYKVVTDRAARIRIYATLAQRIADSGRPIGVDPVGNHGLLFELVTSSDILSYTLSPVVDLVADNEEATYYTSVTNLSAVTGAVTTIFYYVRTG